MKLRPESAAAHYQLARVSERQAWVGIREQELIESLRLNPALVPARLALAQAYLVKNQAEMALQLIDKAPASEAKLLPFVVKRNFGPCLHWVARRNSETL